VWLPQAGLNRTLAELVPLPLPAPIETPPVLRLLSSKRLDGQVTRLALAELTDTGVGIDLEVALRYGGAPVLALAGRVVGQVRPVRADAGAVRAVELAIDPASLRAASWQLAGTTAPAGPTLPLLDQLGDWLREHGEAQLRSLIELAAPQLADLTTVRLDLPVLPLTDLRVEPRTEPEPGLAVLLHTSLPIVTGVGDHPMPRTELPATLVLSNDAMMEIGNWALASQALPAAESSHLAREFPVLTWRGGVRPLQLDVFRLTRPCGRARIGATPTATLEGDTIRVAIDDGVVEQTSGSALYEVLAFSRSIFEGTIEKNRQVASSLALRVGQQPLQVRVASLALGTDTSTLGLAITKPPR
jgi:hypothetical protein